MKLAQAVAQALAQLGVERVFGLVGSGNFVLTEGLRSCGAEFASARHETSAVAMAEGYASVTGRPGVVTVHQGPGYTNALTGMIEAAKSRTPVLLLAADTPAAWVHSNFRMDQAAAAAAGGIRVERLHGVSSAAADLARAWHGVTVERRATALLLPLEVQDADVGVGIGPLPLPAPPMPPAPSAAAIARATELIHGAQRPVIIAGRGAALTGAGAEIADLGEAIGAPLATTVVAHGLFAGHPLGIGISGGFASPLAAELLADADLVIAFGASLSRWTTRNGRLIGADALVLQVDHEAPAIGRHHPVDLGIVADVGETARALLAALGSRGSRPTGRPRARSPERIAAGRWRDQPFADASTAETVDPRALTIALDDLLPRERVIVVDGGHFSGWPAMYLDVPDVAGFIFHQAYQSIGLGLGTAIGAALGRPDRTVVAAVGDGGAFMALGELETATRLALPMIVLVYNDDAYGAEVHHFADEELALDTVRFAPTDLAAVARALGAAGVTVRRPEDLAGVERWLRGPRRRPLLVDAKVTPSVVGEWLPEAFRA